MRILYFCGIGVKNMTFPILVMKKLKEFCDNEIFGGFAVFGCPQIIREIFGDR